MDNYEIEVRDLNGNRRRIKGSRNEVYQLLVSGREEIAEGDEVMWVSLNGSVIWSALASDYVLYKEDLIGFLA